MKLVNFIKECKYPVVCETSMIGMLDEKTYDVFSDARSAAFFAFGKSLKEKRTVLLLIDGQFLSNIYTAVTEAWFQKANVVVISLFSSLQDMKTSYMDRCVVHSLCIEEKDFNEDVVNSCASKKGPCLINILKSDMIIEEFFNYDNIVEKILDSNPNMNIIAYNCCSDKTENILTQYKYGTISRYIGMSINKNVGVLLCNRECVDVDMSVFRTRYSNSNMKIILVGDDFSDISNWIKSNGWIVFNSINEMKAFLSNKKPSVMLIRED